MNTSLKHKLMAGALTSAASIIVGGISYYNMILSNATIDIPTVDVPTLTSYKLSNPSISIPTVDYYKLSSNNIRLPHIERRYIPSDCYDVTKKYNRDRLKNIAAFERDKLAYFKDHVGQRYDIGFDYNNPYCHKWMDIYNTYSSYTNDIAFKKVTYIPKIIAEVRAPITADQKARLYSNITYLKNSYRYNTVLVRFDCTENIDTLMEICQHIKYTEQMKVYIAFSPFDSIDQTIFINPDIFKRYLNTLAPLADGYILGYRRMSQHYTKADEPYTNFILDNLRKYNSNILIFGEIYIGEKYSNRGVFEVTSFVPTNASGAILFNAGVETSDIYSIMKKVDKKINIIGCVIGSKYYYNTKNKTFESFYKSMKIKSAIQNRFINNGCGGYITFISDGCEDALNITSRLSNNLSESIITIGE